MDRFAPRTRLTWRCRPALLVACFTLLALPACASAASGWTHPDRFYRLPVTVNNAHPTAAPPGAPVRISGLARTLRDNGTSQPDGADLRMTYVPAGSGGALQSDTGHGIRITDNLGTLPTFTAEAWVRSHPFVSPMSETTIFGTKLWRLRLSSSTLCVGTTTCIPAPAGGAWFHVAVQRTPAGTSLFVDGVLRVTGVAVSDVFDADFTIGHDSSNTTSFRGEIDEVRISSIERYPGTVTADAALSPDAATVALLHLDEADATTTPDASGQGHHGVVQEARSFERVPAPSGGGIDLHESGSYVMIGHDLGAPAQLTVEMWFRRRTSDPWNYLLDSRLTAGGFWFADNGTSICFNGLACTPRPAIDTWHHIAVTADATATRLYIDGTLMGSGASTSRILGSRLVVGGRHSLDELFGGSIDELRISNTIRYTSNFTPSTSLPGDADTLVAYGFDEASGVTVDDSSPHARDTTIRTPLGMWTAGHVASSSPTKVVDVPVAVDGDDVVFPTFGLLPADQVDARYVMYVGSEDPPALSSGFGTTTGAPQLGGSPGSIVAQREPGIVVFQHGPHALMRAHVAHVPPGERSRATCSWSWDAALGADTGGSATHRFRRNGVLPVSASCRLPDGRQLAASSVIDVHDADATAPRIVPLDASTISRSGRFRFRVTDAGVGVATTRALYGGRRADVRAGTIVEVAPSREGRSRLQVVARDANGNERRWSRIVYVDRTAPTVLPGRHEMYVIGPTGVVPIVERGSGIRGREVRVRVPRIGRQVLMVEAADVAGNRTRRRVVVDRRLSLAHPSLNRGAVRDHGPRSLDRAAVHDVFRFRGQAPPWYGRTQLSPLLVGEVQWRLQHFGFMTTIHSRSGTLDSATIEAIKRFQRSEGIPAIATVGPRTRQALDRRLLELDNA